MRKNVKWRKGRRGENKGVEYERDGHGKRKDEEGKEKIIE